MGIVVIACYKPLPGKAGTLHLLVRSHIALLRSSGFLTKRAPTLAESADGTLVEIFEWRSQAALDNAKEHPAIIDIRNKFAEACHIIPIASLAEAALQSTSFCAIDEKDPFEDGSADAFIRTELVEGDDMSERIGED